jgi:hypothetical protein
MPSIGDTTRPAFAYDSATDTWIPVGIGPHAHTPAAIGAISNSLTTTTGDLIYAASANTPARLPIGSTSQVLSVSGGIPAWTTPAATTPTFAGVQCRNAGTNTTISSATDTVLTWSSENFDSDNYHSTSSNTSRITIPTGKAGKYLVKAAVYWESSPVADALILRIRKNGSGQVQFNALPKTNGNQMTLTTTVTLDLAVGDYLELVAYQNSGSNLTVNGDSTYTFFGVNYLGA